MARRIVPRITLTEAITIEGAELIGTAKGYDLFDITTFAAAQQFINNTSRAEAGTDYAQNESTFNSNVGPNLHMYFFVVANTNRVMYAVIKGNTVRNQTLIINNYNSNRIELSTNFSVENCSHEPTVAYGDTVPFYLLPDIQVENYLDATGCYFEDDTLVAVLPQFSPNEIIDILELPNRIKYIDNNAFYYGQRIGTLLLSDNIEDLPPAVLSNNIQEVAISTLMEAPDSWDPMWHFHYSGNINFGYGLSDEARAEIEAQVQAREREAAEAARIEAERVEREAALKAEREARKLRYRIDGNTVTIKGTRKGISELEIPEEIEGKPVTKIEAYAFYDNTDLKKIILPSSIKLIERSAFLNSGITHPIKVSKDCIVGKDNPTVRKGAQ